MSLQLTDNSPPLTDWSSVIGGKPCNMPWSCRSVMRSDCIAYIVLCVKLDADVLRFRCSCIVWMKGIYLKFSCISRMKDASHENPAHASRLMRCTLYQIELNSIDGFVHPGRRHLIAPLKLEVVFSLCVKDAEVIARQSVWLKSTPWKYRVSYASARSQDSASYCCWSTAVLSNAIACEAGGALNM